MVHVRDQPERPLHIDQAESLLPELLAKDRQSFFSILESSDCMTGPTSLKKGSFDAFELPVVVKTSLSLILSHARHEVSQEFLETKTATIFTNTMLYSRSYHDV